MNPATVTVSPPQQTLDVLKVRESLTLGVIAFSQPSAPTFVPPANDPGAYPDAVWTPIDPDTFTGGQVSYGFVLYDFATGQSGDLFQGNTVDFDDLGGGTATIGNIPDVSSLNLGSFGLWIVRLDSNVGSWKLVQDVTGETSFTDYGQIQGDWGGSNGTYYEYAIGYSYGSTQFSPVGSSVSGQRHQAMPRIITDFPATPTDPTGSRRWLLYFDDYYTGQWYKAADITGVSSYTDSITDNTLYTSLPVWSVSNTQGTEYLPTDPPAKVSQIPSTAGFMVGSNNLSEITDQGQARSNLGIVEGGFTDKPANVVLCGPVSGADAQPGFRSLVVADLPSGGIAYLASVNNFAARQYFAYGLSVTGFFFTANPGGGAGTEVYGDAASAGINQYCLAVGYSATASASYAMCLGPYATASNANATAIGYNAAASGGTSTAIGFGAVASASDAMAIGAGATASVTQAIAIGRTAQATIGAGNISIGQGSYTYGADKLIAIGQTAQAYGSTGNIAIGYGAQAASNAKNIAIGYQAVATGTASMSFGSGNNNFDNYTVRFHQGVTNSTSHTFVMSSRSSTGTQRDLFSFVGSFATSTDASRKCRTVWNVFDTVAREAMRAEASGSAAMLGFFGASAVTRPVVTGLRGGNAALASLLTQLATLGLITDSTTV